ncbi:MAG: PIN domain-containing protein, partial [Pseudomonadota bacterium]
MHGKPTRRSVVTDGSFSLLVARWNDVERALGAYMPLSSTVERHRVFFEVSALLLDTCVLIELADRVDGEALLQRLLSHYTLLVPTVAIYELTFGLSSTVPPSQKALEARLTSAANQRTALNDDFDYSISRNHGAIPTGQIVIVNPTISEWVSARNRLLRRIEQQGAEYGRAKERHSFDALVHSCARNRFAPLCTNNVRDFEHFNRAANSVSYDRSIPIFTLAQALASLETTVVRAGPIDLNRSRRLLSGPC